jgi:hypothetical protein
MAMLTPSRTRGKVSLAIFNAYSTNRCWRQLLDGGDVQKDFENAYRNRVIKRRPKRPQPSASCTYHASARAEEYCCGRRDRAQSRDGRARQSGFVPEPKYPRRRRELTQAAGRGFLVFGDRRLHGSSPDAVSLNGRPSAFHRLSTLPKCSRHPALGRQAAWRLTPCGRGDSGRPRMLLRGLSAPGNLQEFVDLVVPELQRRGLSKKPYRGPMLRDNLLH